MCTLIVCCFGSQNNAQLQPSKVDPGMSQIEKNTILNKRPVIFLITPEVSALQIKMDVWVVSAKIRIFRTDLRFSIFSRYFFFSYYF